MRELSEIHIGEHGRFFRLPNGHEVPIPAYLPFRWLSRIEPEWGPDRHGVFRWHFIWLGWNNGKGHAKVRENGKAVYCHRRVVEIVEQRKLSRFNYVDHKCEREGCLNYDCLEAVTPGENTQRSHGDRHQFKSAAAYVQQESCSGTCPPGQMAVPYGDPLDQL